MYKGWHIYNKKNKLKKQKWLVKLLKRKIIKKNGKNNETIGVHHLIAHKEI